MNDRLEIKPMHPVLNSEVSWDVFDRLLWLPDSTRSMGIHIMAGKGSGKSRLMGRIIAWMDFLRGIPQVIFDPHGPTIDNFLDKVFRMPEELQRRMWGRIRYIDLSGKSGYVVPFPLYYRLKDEGLYEVSQRYLDVVRKIDPYLQTASVEGWNALWRTGTYVGMILAALNYQISEVEQILMNGNQWKNQLETIKKGNLELIPAINYLLEIENLKDNLKSRRTDSLLNKTAIFSLDPTMKAMFGSSTLGLDWTVVLKNRQTVLLDFRRDLDLERRRFKMVWVFNYFLDYIKHRGAGRFQPIGLIIDELTSLFSVQALNSDIFGSELDELINVLARNYSVWLTIAHQEMFQVTERILKSLMTMGTQILGTTTDPEAAKYLARIFYEYQPFLVKKYEAVYGSANGLPMVLDYRSVEFTIEEQLLIQSYQFLKQGKFRFLARPAYGEGDLRGHLHRITLENFDRNIFPDQVVLGELRNQLMKTTAMPISEVLQEIEERRSNQFLDDPQEENQMQIKQKYIPFWG